jgi:hypothetical protein
VLVATAIPHKLKGVPFLIWPKLEQNYRPDADCVSSAKRRSSVRIAIALCH